MQIPRERLEIGEILEQLAATPEQIALLAESPDPELTTAAPDENAWSVNDVLAHLRACADVWGDSIAAMLSGDQPRIRAVNPRSLFDRTGYRELTFAESLQAFAHQRVELLGTLNALPESGWAASAIFYGMGSPVVRSVQSQSERMAHHERAHIDQIRRTIAILQRRG